MMNVITEKLQKAWDCTISEYEKDNILHEGTLQCIFFGNLRKEFPKNKVYAEYSLGYRSKKYNHSYIDIMICEIEDDKERNIHLKERITKIDAMIELKFFGTKNNPSNSDINGHISYDKAKLSFLREMKYEGQKDSVIVENKYIAYIYETGSGELFQAHQNLLQYVKGNKNNHWISVHENIGTDLRGKVFYKNSPKK